MCYPRARNKYLDNLEEVMNTESYRAVVQAVIQGPHGPYVVATAKNLYGSVTFALARDVWQDSGVPEPGAEVVLTDLRRKQAGWRAYSARFLRPADEQSSISI